MLNWLKDKAISIERAKNLSEEELSGAIVTGVFADKKDILSCLATMKFSQSKKDLEGE